MTFSPDGHRLASGGMDDSDLAGAVRIWDADTGQVMQTLTASTDAVYSVAFSPDGHRLASASADNTVRLWDADTGQALAATTDRAHRLGVQRHVQPRRAPTRLRQRRPHHPVLGRRSSPLADRAHRAR